MKYSMKYLYAFFLLSSAVNAYASLDDLPSLTHPLQIIKNPEGRNFSGGPAGLTPDQVKKVYGFYKIANQGEGQKIAIVVPYDNIYAEYDLGIFSSTFSLPPCTTANGCFNKVYASGVMPPQNNDWANEAALDIEWAHAIAPKAQIFLVEASSGNQPDLFKAVQVAATKANIVSMSWVMAEGTWITALNLDSYFMNPNVNFVAATGDDGTGLNYPAVSPYVLAVGGTSLTIDPNTGKRVSEVAWPNSGGGISKVEMAPSQQKQYPLPNNPKQYRGVPDVAYGADGVTAGYSVYNSNPNSLGQRGWSVVGGTSAAAPQWAGLIALANTQAGKNISVKPLLYKIAKQNYKMSFVDITKGQNGNCGYVCQAQVNYDYITGLGAPHAKYIVDNLVKLSA